MAIVEREKYSAQKINKLKEYLQRNSEIGKPIEYEIIVDGLKAVQRTNDPEHFDLHETLIDTESKSVEIIFYKGSSNHNERRLYWLREDNSKEGGLSGIDIENRIQEELEKVRKENELTGLRNENAELTVELEELEKEIIGLQTTIAEMKAKQSPLNGMLGEVGSSFVESFIRRNPQLLTALPGGQSLAGLVGSDDSKTEAPLEGVPETEVSFKPKGNTTQSSLSEEDQAAIIFVNQIKARFNQFQFNKILQVLEKFARKDALIDDVLELLKDEEPKL